MKQLLEIIIAFGVVVGMVLGGVSYFAKAEELVMVEMRLDQKIVSDSLSQVQSRVWALEDRNDNKPCAEWKNESEKTEYRNLKEQLKVLDEKQKILIHKGVK